MVMMVSDDGHDGDDDVGDDGGDGDIVIHVGVKISFFIRTVHIYSYRAPVIRCWKRVYSFWGAESFVSDFLSAQALGLSEWRAGKRGDPAIFAQRP